MKALFIASLFVLLLAGCKTKPIYHGPNYQLNDIPEHASTGPVAVELTDARPWWEKRFYDGYFKLVPMENLQPSPLPLLAQEIQRQAQKLTDPPLRAKLAVDSFRVVIYDKAKEEAERNKTFTFILTDDYEADDIKGFLAAVCVECCAECIAEAAYWSALLTRDGLIEWGQKERHLHGPPRHIKDKYPEGLSCDLRVSAELEWRNGQRRTVHMRALVSANAISDDKTDQMRDTIYAACTQVAQEWAEKLRNPRTSEETPQMPPKPQFTAFSRD